MLYEFQDLDLEEMAFTSNNCMDAYNMTGITRRYTNPTYERLEWLGEGILKFLVSEALYATLPDLGGKSLMVRLLSTKINSLYHSYCNHQLIHCFNRL